MIEPRCGIKYGLHFAKLHYHKCIPSFKGMHGDGSFVKLLMMNSGEKNCLPFKGAADKFRPANIRGRHFL